MRSIDECTARASRLKLMAFDVDGVLTDCSLFFTDAATTRDINKAQIYAWRKGIKTIYYIRLRQQALEGTEVEGCVSCTL